MSKALAKMAPQKAPTICGKKPTLTEAIRAIREAKKPACKVCALKEVDEVNRARSNGAKYSEIAQGLAKIGISVSADKVGDHFVGGHDKAR